MIRPVVVYLDTSAWSAVEKLGVADPSVRFLADLGACGAAVYVASMEIMEEVPSRTTETNLRLAAMARFPGAALIDVTAVQLFKQEAAAMAAQVENASPRAPLSVDALPLKGISDADLSARVRAFRAVRPMRRVLAFAQRTSRAATRGNTKDDRKATQKRVVALLKGDIDKLGPLGPIRKALLKATRPLISAAVERAVRGGVMAPPETRFDQRFSLAVLPYLPDQSRRTPDVVTRIHKLWRSSRGPELAPGITCAAAVSDATHRDTARKYLSSDEVDPLHAGYAPYVDVFTGDKRTCDALKRLEFTNGGFLRTKVERAAPLQLVAAAVGAAALRRFSASADSPPKTE